MTLGKENQLAASMNTEFSVTIRMPYKTDGHKLESLFVTFTSEIDLEIEPDHPIFKEEINRIVGEDDPTTALARLLELGDLATDQRISGRPDNDFLTLGTPEQPIRMTVNDAKGQPIRDLKRHEQELEWERTRQGSLRAQFLAVLLVVILERIGSKYRVDLDVLSCFFRTQFISVRDAAIFARALHYYWEGFYDDAARVALPSIESVIRSIVQTVHGNSYIEPKQGRDGHESTLGRLISMLDPHLPKSFRLELGAVLTDPLGLNLRNTHLHGLAEPYPKHDAAIVLYTAARLTLIHAVTNESPSI